jgi:hypothetical protein
MADGKPPKPKGDQRKHREDQLDQALAESFPASDPPAMVAPHPRRDALGD